MLDRLVAAQPGQGERAARNREEAKRAVTALFLGQGEAGDTRGQAPGTTRRAPNAICEYSDFRRRVTRRTNQVQRSFEHSGLKQRGLELLMSA